MWLKRLFLVHAILDIFQQAIYFMSEKFINLLLSSSDFLFPLSNVVGHCNRCSYAISGSVSGSELEPNLDYQPGIRKKLKENMHTDGLKIVLLLIRL